MTTSGGGSAVFERVTAASVPEPPPGLYSNALKAGHTLYLAGQHAGAPGGGVLGDGTMADQTRQALHKIKGLVEAAGGTMANVVKLTVYVTDIDRRAEVSAARREFFSGDLPCSTLVEISGLAGPDLLVEIDAIAVI
jgi:enamine deaminase RidA (YjgF/YER057c/UK114 family)